MKNILVVILGFAGVIYTTALSAAEQPRPLNFVVILADDLGARSWAVTAIGNIARRISTGSLRKARGSARVTRRPFARRAA